MNRHKTALAFVSLALVVAGACTDSTSNDDGDDITEVDASGDDGKADAASELKVRTGETSVWMTKQLERRETADGPLFVLRGRASRNITSGTGFVFDDPYGDFASNTPRTFEVAWPVSTARTLVDGVDQFVRLQFVHSATRPDTLTSRVVVRPRLAAFTGSSSIYLTAELTPVVYGGVVVYRARGRSSAPLAALAVTANGQALTDVRIVDSTHFEIDLDPELAFAIAGSGAADAELSIAAELAAGNVVTKHARLGLAIKKLGITAGDVEQTWPRLGCTTATSSCLQGLLDGTLDLGGCGEAIAVLPCAGQVGVFVDDIAVQAAIADGEARTADPAFLSDAVGLVGDARKDAFAYGALQTVEDRVQRLFGRWYLSAAARSSVVSLTIDRALVTAYAHPLDLVEPSLPTPDDPAATRQVAADALLRALEQYDFPASEFARTYDDIVAEFRDQHVAAIRSFRESIAIEPHYTLPDHDVMIGSWLGPYIEVTLDRASGTASNVYIEID
ncbi:MAG: hypothetical protein AB7P03_29920 [Kofleriaceae bacterium]